MHFCSLSNRRNFIVPVALAMGLLRALLSTLLVCENSASAEMPRLRKQPRNVAPPDKSFEEEYLEEEDSIDEEVPPGPRLGLMRSRTAKSVLVTRGKKQARPTNSGDKEAFDSETFADDTEALPPVKSPAKRSRASQQETAPRPISPGVAASRQKFLPGGDKEPDEEEYDDPTCAAEPSKQKGHHGPDYPGPHLQHEPLLPPSKWRIYTSPLFAHNDPADPMRHHGWGEPLYGTSWRNRPWYVSPFVGGLIGDDIQKDAVRQGGNFFAGLRLGNDFDHFFGAETRLAFSDLSLSYPAAGFSTGKSSNIAMFDGSLLYYPLGDTRWRPYWTTGIGISSFHYFDSAGNKFRGSSMTIPFGGGLKVKIRPAIALRFDIVDNFAVGSGEILDKMHNVSFTGGFEWHFGGRTTNYYPW
jgi:hypothetical protein